jgi:PAB1-binding protein PBP1
MPPTLRSSTAPQTQKADMLFDSMEECRAFVRANMRAIMVELEKPPARYSPDADGQYPINAYVSIAVKLRQDLEARRSKPAAKPAGVAKAKAKAKKGSARA